MIVFTLPAEGGIWITGTQLEELWKHIHYVSALEVERDQLRGEVLGLRRQLEAKGRARR